MPRDPAPRPAKTALSREAVVAAALRVVDEVGYDAASMRRVAAELETGPASLYVYVADRRELMEAVHDLALADVELPTGADGDWRARLELLIDRMVAALSAHADIAMAAIAGVPLGPHSLRVNEEVLRLLRVGGIDDAACAWAADLARAVRGVVGAGAGGVAPGAARDRRPGPGDDRGDGRGVRGSHRRRLRRPGPRGVPDDRGSAAPG